MADSDCKLVVETSLASCLWHFWWMVPIYTEQHGVCRVIGPHAMHNGLEGESWWPHHEENHLLPFHAAVRKGRWWNAGCESSWGRLKLWCFHRAPLASWRTRSGPEITWGDCRAKGKAVEVHRWVTSTEEMVVTYFVGAFVVLAGLPTSLPWSTWGRYLGIREEDWAQCPLLLN